jgi:hypothetical protein
MNEGIDLKVIGHSVTMMQILDWYMIWADVVRRVPVFG